ncbi:MULTISPECIES: protein-glutamate O-methyltransferase CheR [unclassified Cupriavidus]|uniref:CheR family methyltransferase n=1 Tax=unclassified Cupriavidus TaxID=2640874 RepID=UPI001C004E39|nr:MULTISPECIES: protein-glutamate O-methyltransferase CheR [unclassified Cupriavidus]MCA3183763.1 chemotaxis protein CheW [Cupriavidus sp.]MCA3188793.1 chemotaxis protein CheW [Cupriavidus sp.]MCA3198513.1 chemotaxis protein CheW [Cupriavidus sp.]MCA3201259.1 chemotaxis protein CheW [Cupriavidus sp.]MCA3208459.1 chemotaxis protein CheW [Cupriavidus sp.]
MTDLPHPPTQIEALLKERIGLDAAAIGPAVIARAVEERRLAVGARDPGAYWNLLHAVPDELQALIEAVVVPETWFFRHREALLALGRFAAHRAFGDGERLLRVLSLPCSTGEEPYSIAMALFDAGLPADRFRVDAVDVSARALERARAGLYGSNAFRGVPLDFRDRYFAPAPTGYHLSEKVRAQVRLLQGNLMSPGLLANEAPYDFVFCRNLLIYFDPATQQQAVQTLRRLTAAHGLIFVGPAEASLLTREGLSGAGVPLAFAFHPMPAATAPAAPAKRAWQPAVPLAPARPAPTTRATRMPAAGVTVNPARAANAANAAASTPLASISAMADRGELDAATAACQQYLADHGSSPDGWCLLGVLHDAAGRIADAHAAYRKAVYLDPGHEEALYHLAALLDSEGDASGAHRLRERAQRHARLSHG